MVVLLIAASFTCALPPARGAHEHDADTSSNGQKGEGEGEVADGCRALGMAWDVADQILVPMARSLEPVLVLEACKGLLQLSGLMNASDAARSAPLAAAGSLRRWNLAVVEGSLLLLARRDSDAGAKLAMRHLLVSLHLLPPSFMREQVARQVLVETLGLRQRDVRIQTLLIFFWRLVWGGVDHRRGKETDGDEDERVSLLHSEAMMDMLQRDPDGSEGILPDIVITYAQACLLPPPPRCRAVDFVEARAIEYLEMFNVCLRCEEAEATDPALSSSSAAAAAAAVAGAKGARGHGRVAQDNEAAARSYLQLLARTCARVGTKAAGHSGGGAAAADGAGADGAPSRGARGGKFVASRWSGRKSEG
jgi:hypothetical protein